MPGEASGIPARGYSWPPFEKGNTQPEKHGAYMSRRVDPVAKDLVERVLDQVAYLTDPSYEGAVWAWGRAEARVLVLSSWLDEHGPLDEDGVPRPALAALLQFERLASNHRTRLGLDPLSRAQLGRDVAAQNLDLARFYESLEDSKS
jgi:hypothetical protein